MKHISLLFLISLILINFTSSVKLTLFENSLLPSNNMHSLLLKMLRQLKQGKPSISFKDILDTLRKMIIHLNQEQKKHSELSKASINKCIKEDLFRHNEVKEAQASFHQSTESKRKCQLFVSALLKELPEMKKLISVYQTQLDEALTQRKEQHQLYTNRNDSFKQSNKFLLDFLNLIKTTPEKDLPKINIGEKSENIIRLSSKLNHLSKTTPILIAMSQIQQEDYILNDYTVRNRIQGIHSLTEAIEAMITALKKDQDIATERENELQVAFEAYRLKLEVYIIKLIEAMMETEEKIKVKTECVMHEDKVSGELKAKLERNTLIQGTAHNLCKSFAQDYIKATKDRYDNFNTIQVVIEICQIRFNDILPKKEFKDKVQKGKLEWDAYLHSTEYNFYLNYLMQPKKNQEKDSGGKILIKMGHM